MLQYGYVSKAEVRTDAKYGSTHSSMFALEDIKKDQVIFRCDPKVCGAYMNHLEHPEGMTKDEVEDFLLKHPEHKDFVLRYYYMKDDDCFNFDRKFRGLCPCYFPNHCCDSNTSVKYDEYYTLIAKKDIKAGEEITMDYQILGTEYGFHTGMDCKCGSHKCKGILKFDYYRNIDWVNENYKYCNAYIRRRIDELKTKWFSSSCYVKNYNNKTETGLTALKKIMKNELIAIYSDPTKITREAHFLRHSDNPTCFVNKDGEVYAKQDIVPNTELTIDFKVISA